MTRIRSLALALLALAALIAAAYVHYRGTPVAGGLVHYRG